MREVKDEGAARHGGSGRDETELDEGIVRRGVFFRVFELRGAGYSGGWALAGWGADFRRDIAMCERCKELTRELYAVRDELTAARQSVAVLEMELTIARAQGSELAFYTAEQAANLIQVSVATIYSYIHQGAIPAFRKGTGKGGVIRIRKQDMAEFIKAYTQDRFES